MEAKIIVLPDIHGRTFWKDVMDYKCDIIFLGDYVDPYPHEGISKPDALENFIAILEFAKTHPNVHLLYGNHDCEYSIGQDVCDCRCDYDNFDTIRNLFLSNAGLFNFAYAAEVNGKKYVFSHAGFHPAWVQKHSDLKLDHNSVNEYLRDDKMFDKLHVALCDVSRHRGGWSRVGSMIWADILEYDQCPMPSDCIQVVGHTYLKSIPVGNDSIVCIDLRRPFMIDETGELCEIDGTKIDKYII